MNNFKTLFLLFVVSLISMQIEAQSKVTLSGKITDQSGTPLSQVTIAVENTSRGAYSDNDGKYALQLAQGKYTLVISYIGYETVKQTVDLQRNKVLNFKIGRAHV